MNFFAKKLFLLHPGGQREEEGITAHSQQAEKRGSDERYTTTTSQEAATASPQLQERAMCESSQSRAAQESRSNIDFFLQP
jgi:hypothetical protein